MSMCFRDARGTLLSRVVVLVGAGVLSACGSTAPASGGSATSGSATGVTASGAATTGATATSGSATNATASGATASSVALPGDPWNHAEFHVGFMSAPAGVSGQQIPIIVTPAKWVQATGAEGWAIVKTGTAASGIDVAPTVSYSLSCTWSGKQGPADGSDRCPITGSEFTSWIRRTDVPEEFWYHLDDQGKIDVLFQVYHP